MVKEMSITTRSPRETERLGRLLGELLASGDVVFLSGEVGAGKTTFTKGVARGLGVLGEVVSPTFTLVCEYEGRVPFAHMDLYRLYDSGGHIEDALAEFGWEDYLEGDYVVFVEWPAALEMEVEDAIHIEIFRGTMPNVDERTFHCRSTGSRSWTVLDEWVKKWLF